MKTTDINFTDGTPVRVDDTGMIRVPTPMAREIIAALKPYRSDIITHYAMRFLDADNDLSLTQFVRYAADDVLPGKFFSRGQRATFKHDLRNEIRRREIQCQ